MKLVALALAGCCMLGASPAFAQYYGPYGPVMRPVMPIGGMAGGEVINLVREMGLEPVGRPTRSGNFYIQNAADYYGRPMRIVIDARRAQVVSVEALNAPGSIHGAPYTTANARTGGGPYGGVPGYGLSDDGYDDASGLPLPRSTHANLGAMPPDQHIQPPRIAPKPAAKSATKSAAITPAKPPVPRKRPAAAPQETAGTVEPLPPAKLEVAPAATAAPATEAKPSEPTAPAAPSMPPVAPLE